MEIRVSSQRGSSGPGIIRTESSSKWLYIHFSTKNDALLSWNALITALCIDYLAFIPNYHTIHIINYQINFSSLDSIWLLHFKFLSLQKVSVGLLFLFCFCSYCFAGPTQAKLRDSIDYQNFFFLHRLTPNRCHIPDSMWMQFLCKEKSLLGNKKCFPKEEWWSDIENNSPLREILSTGADQKGLAFCTQT